MFDTLRRFTSITGVEFPELSEEESPKIRELPAWAVLGIVFVNAYLGAMIVAITLTLVNTLQLAAMLSHQYWSVVIAAIAIALMSVAYVFAVTIWLRGRVEMLYLRSITPQLLANLNLWLFPNTENFKTVKIA